MLNWITCLALVFLCCGIGRAADKPNILLIISDDHSWHDAGCYGNTAVRTPHIDALASGGLRFMQAFTGTAMCSPSRSMLFTGMYPLRNGAYPNHSQVKPAVVTLPTYFRELGYRVALAGKVHVGPREQFPFEYIGREAAGRFMKQGGDEPFVLVYATNDPHVPWTDKPAYDPAEVIVPPYLVDTPETRHELARYYTDVTAMDTEIGKVLAELRDSGHEDDTLVIYAADHGAQFPFAKWTLYDAGIRTPFIVRWPGVVEPGTTTFAMIHFIDVLPTLLDIAGGTIAHEIDGQSFAVLLRGGWGRDPANRNRIKGRSVVYGIQTTRGIIDGSDAYPIRSIRTRGFKYILNLNPDEAFENVLISEGHSGWPSWVARAGRDSIARERVKLYQHRPAEEFYDTASDPYELHNLADDPAYRHAREQMKNQLLKWMATQNDRGLETEMKVQPHAE